MDIEFVFDKAETLYLLQARAETVWAGSEEVVRIVSREAAQAAEKEGRLIFQGGLPIFPAAYSGTLRVVGKDLKAAQNRVRHGDIVVSDATTNVWEPVLFRCGAAITDVGDEGCHTALIMGEQKKPALVATGNATDLLELYDNREVTIDTVSQSVPG